MVRFLENEVKNESPTDKFNLETPIFRFHPIGLSMMLLNQDDTISDRTASATEVFRPDLPAVLSKRHLHQTMKW
jgi:hypothetical protein